MYKLLVVAAALASTAVADILPRQTPTLPSGNLSLGDATACVSAWKTYPTPPPSVMSMLTGKNAVNSSLDMCNTSLPLSVQSEISTYIASGSMWLKTLSDHPDQCTAMASGLRSLTNLVDCSNKTINGTTNSTAPGAKKNSGTRQAGPVAIVAVAGFALAAL